MRSWVLSVSLSWCRLSSQHMLPLVSLKLRQSLVDGSELFGSGQACPRIFHHRLAKCCSLQNLVWFFPLDGIKFAMKATIIKKLRARHEVTGLTAIKPPDESGVSISRTQSRAASIHESMYSNRVSFIKRAARKVGFGGRISIKPEELQRFNSIQAQYVHQTLARNPSRTPT
jgi:hypothetical protein